MSKTNALKAAKRTQGRLDEAESKATEWAQARDKAVGFAQSLGATYAEIQEATGLSTSRVTQILRRARG